MDNKLYCFADDFVGNRVYSTTKGSNVGHGYNINDTSSNGTPTYAPSSDEPGAIKVDMDSDSEIENVCLSEGDVLQWDIDKLVEFRCRVKMNQAALDSTTSFAIGLASERNDAIDSIAEAALFRLVGSDAVVVETDDGTTDNDDVATGQELVNAYKELVISFALGKSDVRFFIDGQPVAQSQTFDMSGYSGGLQLYAQIQKTADTNIDGFTLDYWEVRGRR